ncbi:putative disease resistance protein At4g10780 [Euphorbia lathyris]|uniref:putative disease resistance protein At4g10780 n=1 Tax=Euphorbia lathyris TaxID=212925 RepID=UPI00331335B6
MSVVGFDSLLNQAWNMIMERSSGSIAILGDGGTGKTTLMRLLYNKLLATKKFETVIWVTVSSNLTIEKIQDDISRSMKLFDAKWVRKSAGEKSKLIRSELAAKKSVLLCLDDVWDKLVLSGVGHDEARGNWGSNCTLIFTTRSRKIAESARRVLFIDELLMEDALRLFRRKVGEEWIESDRRISDMARILVRKCEGLPIILCTVGRAMARRRTYENWICAFDEIERNDRELGLLEQEHHNVNMLDMIREFCLFLVIKSQMFKHARLIEPTDSEKLETVGWISPMGSFIRNLGNVVPEILFTFLLNHNPFVMIRGEFSEFMDALTVLDLSNSGVEEVPLEISRLISLQYLNLSHTWIEQLPIELRMLKNLRCLSLEHDDQLRVIPKQILYGLSSSLRVLKMFRCGYSVEEVRDNILSATKMDVDPLLCLKHLQVLSITITCASALDKLYNNPKLLSCIQSLSLEVFWDSKSLNISRLASMNSLLTLEIRQAENLREFSLEHSLQERNFRRLEEVTIEKCSSLEELTWIITIPNLRTLRIKSCEQLKEVIDTTQYGEIWKRLGEEVQPIFAKLEILVLESLPELKSIYWQTLCFPCLKRMEIMECSQLKRLPLDSNSAKRDEVIIEAEEDWWKDVTLKDAAAKAAFLPCFKPLLV